mmetsp:Transcript_12830/g.23121  ORF Transcript_12830/g.23121 Transcript_12830/m.23121 type:complete len:364 (-) Transcript_12830:45-1136(-)|eukprot:CAMPEP_0203756552 /NCGR_PEP_ID=MMETSP0098-20131031/9816_1 /ASSEMBLY_ACC=CAM_ASM_000208 /TAXON_ID=96639 /ORGANISM=" , Strain NY0313808BC1" /LENGTH=363 /DNA_ID=CAMNT_0050648479 /DNA_START=288 /DNA_END=1379 /DNA_ORIENTATION=+
MEWLSYSTVNNNTILPVLGTLGAGTILSNVIRGRTRLGVFTIGRLALCSGLAALPYWLMETYPVHDPLKSAVLVTGSSSGIGKETSIRYAEKGYTVLATVRKDEDMKRLQSTKAEMNFKGEIIPIRLDVTNMNQVKQLSKTIQETTDKPLVGVVLNQGIVGNSLPLEYTPAENVGLVENVNVQGSINVLQNVLHLIRQNNGRVIITGSMVGKVHLGSFQYTRSKVDLEVFADTLRREMRMLHDAFPQKKVSVSLLEVGILQTEIMKKNTDIDIEGIKADHAAKNDDYLWDYHLEQRESVRKSTEIALKNAQPVATVGPAMIHALCDPIPLPRYVVGVDARIVLALGYLLPDLALDAILSKKEK